MATFSSWAQDIILCETCGEPALRFCNSCQVKLCKACVNSHIESNESLSHDIGTYQQRNLHLVFSECKFHPGQRCETYCQQCQITLCTTCFIDSHRGHSIEALDSVITKKKKDIEKRTIEIEGTLIPRYKTIHDDVQKKMLKASSEYEELEKKKEDCRSLWHTEVDKIFNGFGTLIQSKKGNDLTNLIIIKTKINNEIEKLSKTVEKQEIILKSNTANEVMNYTLKLLEEKEFKTDIDVETPSVITKNLHGRGLRIEIGGIKAILARAIPHDHVSYLSTEKLSKKAEVIATIPIDDFARERFKLACVGEDEAWIGGDRTPLMRIDMKGSIQNTIISKHPPRDISVTRFGELAFSDSIDRSVNIVKQGKVYTLITTPQDWIPWGICCTTSGDILVNVFKAQRNKIIRYHEEKITQEIYQDESGNPIFSEGYCMLYMAENNNRVICVSDSNANGVIGINMKGKVLFQYKGNGAKRQKPFAPGNIVTNSQNQIIVTDVKNDCLHILDQTGKFVTCVDNFEPDHLCGLGLDGEERLWVGLLKTRKIKVIEYM